MTDQPTTDQLTIDEAAAALGISREAVRLRIRRGTLAGEKVDGAWVVRLVGRSQTGTVVQRPTMTDRPTRPARRDELVAELRDRVAFLERLVEHQAGVLAQQSASLAELVQRTEQPAASPTPTPDTPWAGLRRESDEGRDDREQTATRQVRRPWWRRLLGGA